MPLDPHAVYQLRSTSDNFLRARSIALGVKPAKFPHPETNKETDGVWFITNTERPHYILGDPKDTEKGVEIVDAGNIGDDGQPVVWEFVPLTMALFDEMGTSICGYKQLRQALPTEAALHTFFVENFLPDGWLPEEET